MNGRPSPYRLDYRLGTPDYWDVSDAAVRLTKQACTSSARLLEDRSLRMRFNRDVAYFAKQIVSDVESGKKPAEQAMVEIRFASIKLGQITIDVASKLIGLVAGAGQIKSGLDVCFGSRGILCVPYGVPMLAHGINNVYENSVNLYTGQSDAEGWVRQGYHAAAKAAGADKVAGNIAYASVDITLSAYSLLKLSLKPGTWRLFRHIPDDFARGYELMSKSAMVVEMQANHISLKQIRDELKK